MTTKEYFNQEYNAWHNETMFLSTGIYDNEHFDNIVKMGTKAVPYLYDLLKAGPNQIVHALDLIFPGAMEYEGFVPLKEACKTWCTAIEYLKLENEIPE